jgi:hypothetical protein
VGIQEGLYTGKEMKPCDKSNWQEWKWEQKPTGSWSQEQYETRMTSMEVKELQVTKPGNDGNEQIQGRNSHCSQTNRSDICHRTSHEEARMRMEACRIKEK